ncbi:MAG: hypothetical protein OK455_06695 [Thaumarchaeota archaeon]|nr:hypothetical protein [Nitrososphaerota archaeon]
MSLEDARDTIEYWRGRYLESVEARKQYDELVKQLFSQAQTQRASTFPLAQMSSTLAALNSILMLLFGIYSTETGADIGVPMIIIGAIFGTVVAAYLLMRRRDPPSRTTFGAAAPSPKS